MIVVTGADGIVGRAVVERLRVDGGDVLPIVRRRQPRTDERALVIDLSAPAAIKALPGRDLAGIVHLAAAVPHSVHHPDSEASAARTRAMDETIHRWARTLGAPTVYMSTCGLYDRRSPAVKLEDDRSLLGVETPYFGAKLAGERLFTGSGTNATVLRLAAPVGRGLKRSLVLSRFILAARQHANLQVWGSGSREQSFVDVRDVAELIARVLSMPRPGIVNVASAQPVTMLALAHIVVEAMGAGHVVQVDRPDPRDGETARYSIERAQEWFGWSPAHSLQDSCAALRDDPFEDEA